MVVLLPSKTFQFLIQCHSSIIKLKIHPKISSNPFFKPSTKARQQSPQFPRKQVQKKEEKKCCCKPFHACFRGYGLPFADGMRGSWRKHFRISALCLLFVSFNFFMFLLSFFCRKKFLEMEINFFLEIFLIVECEKKKLKFLYIK